MLLTACSSSDDNGLEEKLPTTLTIYVYSPDHPMLIRGDVGPVDASLEESKITFLQIWIFESGTGDLVGYLETDETSLLSYNEGAKYQIAVDDDFAQYKPDVDVYVFANVRTGNCGLTFDKNSTRDQLKGAKLDNEHFGWLPQKMVSKVPDAGLPMVGVLTNQPVVGESPVLRIGTQSNIATVKLERVVSKLRFVFANTANTNPENTVSLWIQNIQMDETMIPTEEYLIPQTKELTYNTAPISFLSNDNLLVKAVENPTLFIYDGQDAQAYEKLINDAELTTVGPFYLRESDKQLQGTINYKIGENDPITVPFLMDQAGDFSRNHTWIVYGYLAGGGFLEMNTLYIKKWTTREIDHEVYNW